MKQLRRPYHFSFRTVLDDDFDDHHFGDRVQILDRPKKTGNVCYIVRAVIEEPSDEANRESHYLLIQVELKI